MALEALNTNTPTEVDVNTTPDLPVGKAAATKNSPYSLPTSTSPTGVDAGILKRMEQMIAERDAQKGSLLESMKDANAWWSGGMAGPGEALRARAAEREGNEATTFGMRRDIAQYKVAQEQAKNMARNFFGASPASPLAAGTTQPTGTTQPAGTIRPIGVANAPSAAVGPTAGTNIGAQPTGGMLDLVRDQDYKQALAFKGQTDLPGAIKDVQAYLAANAKDPDIVKKVRYMVSNGMIDPKLVPTIMLTEAVGSGAMIPHDVRGPSGTGQSTPFATAARIVKGNAPVPTAVSPTGMNVPAPRAAVPTAPVAPPIAQAPVAPPVTQAPVTTAPVTAATTPVVKPPVVTAPVTAPVTPPMAPPVAPIAPISEPPLVPKNIVTGFAPGSKEDLETKAKFATQNIENKGEQQKPIEKGAGESAVTLTNAAGKAKDNIQQYDMAEAILRQYPKAFGISQDGSVTAMLSQLIGPGVQIPIVGTLKAPGLEEARAQKLGPKALAARATFDTLSSRFATDYANQNLTGEGRGTLSNADLKMAGVAKGLSKDVPAAANLIFAVLNRENEQMILERGKAWTAYQQQMRNAGYQPDFNRFRETEAYTKAMDAKEARIAKRFPEFFTAEANAKSTSGGKSPADFMRGK
jgi:hypothetical protein